MKKIDSTSIFLFLAFPGYFFYHLVRPYLMPNSGIGWFTLVMIGIVSYYFFQFILRDSPQGVFNRSTIWLIFPFGLLVVSQVIVIIVSYLELPSDTQTIDALVFGLQIIIMTVAMFLLGLGVERAVTCKKLVPLLVLSIVYAAASILYFDTSSGVFVIPYGFGEELDIAYGLTANYQGVARSVMYTALIGIPYMQSRKLKTIVMFSYVLMLYFIGSRADLLLFLVIIPFFIYINYTLRTTLIAGGLLVSSLALWLMTTSSTRFSMEDAQMSLSERHLFLINGLERIAQYPFTGEYLGQVRDFGTFGSYIHNILSMWSQFGLTAFLIYFYLVILVLLYALTIVPKRKKGTPELLVYLAVTSFLGVLLFRAITWPMPAMAWGVAISILNRTQSSKERNSLASGAASP